MTRDLIVILVLGFLPLCAASQDQQDQSEQYANYTLLLVGPPSVGPNSGVVPMVTKDRKQIEFVPVSSSAKAMNDGEIPIHYGELLQILRKLAEDNQHLAQENDRLWKIAEKPQAQAPPVIVQSGPTPEQQEYAARQEMRMSILRSLLTPRSLPPPVQVWTPPPQTNCVSNKIGTTTYTNCH